MEVPAIRSPYIQNNGKKRVDSFCTISNNNAHNPAAIWAHLHPILSNIKVNFNDISTVHFFSDGPATQYRQKQIFYFVCSKLFTEYNFKKVTWNFFEAGPGKGAADGIGGFLKRAADAKVATGTDIVDAESFFHSLKDSSKIKLYLITDDDIQNVSATVPENIVPLQGTMQVHQIFTDTLGTLKYRNLSCFCNRGFCLCQNPQVYDLIEKVSETVSAESLPWLIFAQKKLVLKFKPITIQYIQTAPILETNLLQSINATRIQKT